MKFLLFLPFDMALAKLGPTVVPVLVTPVLAAAKTAPNRFIAVSNANRKANIILKIKRFKYCLIAIYRNTDIISPFFWIIFELVYS